MCPEGCSVVDLLGLSKRTQVLASTRNGQSLFQSVFRHWKSWINGTKGQPWLGKSHWPVRPAEEAARLLPGAAVVVCKGDNAGDEVVVDVAQGVCVMESTLVRQSA